MSETTRVRERRALVEAMARSCAERGYEQLDEEAIAAQAGLPGETMAELFPAGMEECALAAVEAILAEGMAAVGKGYAADRSEWESVMIALKTLLDLFARRPAFARLAFIGSRQSLPASARERYEAGFSILTAMLDRLRGGSGGDGQAPSTAARAAIGGGEVLMRRELACGRAEALPSLLPHLVYTATVPFLGQAEALRLARRARELSSPAAPASPGR